jgi:signal transduction histidine kinase
MALYGSCERETRSEAALRLRRCRRSLRRLRERLARETEARESAERACAEKDRALAAVCHDLRTPLNAILGWAQVARACPGDGGALREAISRIEANARLQGMLISDILDLARSAAGMLRVERQPLDLNAIAEAALAVTEPAAAAKGVAVEWQPAPAPARVLGDAVRLQQVVWNLLTNAIKFTPAGGRVTVAVSRDGDEVVLRVSDTGRGINPEFMARLFERFQQDAPAGARHAAGAGIGLSIVRRLVEVHGGSVQAHSDGAGRGAAFTVRLPTLRPGHHAGNVAV